MGWTSEKRRVWEREYNKRPHVKEKKAARNRAYRENNKEKILAHSTAWRKKRVAWLQSLKEGKPCVDCGGIFHPVAMHWHHNGNKEFHVSQGWGKPKDQIEKEIAKCELVCANCHAVRSWA